MPSPRRLFRVTVPLHGLKEHAYDDPAILKLEIAQSSRHRPVRVEMLTKAAQQSKENYFRIRCDASLVSDATLLKAVREPLKRLASHEGTWDPEEPGLSLEEAEHKYLASGPNNSLGYAVVELIPLAREMAVRTNRPEPLFSVSEISRLVSAFEVSLHQSVGLGAEL